MSNNRSVGLTRGYINKIADDSDHPHRHLGDAMVGSPDCTDSRVVIMTKHDDGTIAITNFSKHEEHLLQDFTLETIHNAKEDTWDLLNKNVLNAIHPGDHGYAEDSNIMIVDGNIQRQYEKSHNQQGRIQMSNTIQQTDNDNFLVQAKFTNNDTKPSEVRDLVYDTLQDHLNGDVKSSRIFIASEMNDGSVHISHLSTTNNQTRSELNNFMFTNGTAMFANMAAGFDQALDNITNGGPEQIETK